MVLYANRPFAHANALLRYYVQVQVRHDLEHQGLEAKPCSHEEQSILTLHWSQTVMSELDQSQLGRL